MPWGHVLLELLFIAALFLQIYTESLLCSGVDSNIQLAVRHLSLHPSSSSSGSSSPSQLATEWTGEEEAGEDVVTDFKLSYAVSVDLVVGAAKEYFNSAANLMDDDMDLARCALLSCFKNL